MSLALERFICQARDFGCPRDQIDLLVRFGQVLQPKQLKASAAARECDIKGGPQFILFGGARGPGKSHWAIVQAACDDCQRCPGLKVLLLRKVAKAAKEGFDDLRMRILAHVPHHYARGAGILRFPNGSRIIIGHFKTEKDVDAYLGLEYDLIIIEEAGTLTKAKIDTIRTCLRTSKPDWRPRMYLTTNPGGVGHAYLKKWFVVPWRQGKETETRFIPATVDDNRMVNEEYVRTQLDTLKGWQLKAWRYGDWDIMAGQFFINWHEETHKIKPWPELPETAEFYLSLDYGWTHWSASHLGMVYENERHIVDEFGARQTLVTDIAAGVHSMLERNGLEFNDITRAVAGHDLWVKRPDGTQLADQFADCGLKFEKAQVDRINGAGEIVNLLGEPFCEEEAKKPKLFVWDRCGQLIEQIPAMEHDPKRPDDVLKVNCDDNGEGGDDFYDDARYLVMEMAPSKRGWHQNLKTMRALEEARAS